MTDSVPGNGQHSPPPAGSAPSSQVKSATRTLDIIEYVVAHDRPLVAQEIAVALGIPVSSLSYLLSTLVERHYLTREGRRYSAGPGLERLQAKSGGFSLSERAAPLVRTLRVQLNETTSFFVRSEWDVEATVTETSEQSLRYSIDIGKRIPMHVMASGKALLAAMTDEELDRYFEESERQRFTSSTVTGEKQLRQQLAKIRKEGFAMTDEERSLGICGIGRVVTIGGEPVGALSVAVPKVRFNEQLCDRVKDLLERTSSLLEAG
ncbi:IclR family acetate operon transcriptional repressor [Altererythrobacter atlanticus]|uniref:Acetate operon repressor n=1 Tax=Croceibacterium atlanticum TaxID=1267766 RepID=A0A0F7KU94_9SPHN|nr:IclR family transcriptional regulator [Croceibacterium atlanticum]AKH43893.1 Acetate operon repressor [Croceibacterium atlanticum]MBB5733657.1 IclR family acetate operon transcriptional repressor [Croceibacterium atlanticum]